MTDEPKYYSETFNFNDLEITFRGERYAGLPILDTSVKIEGKTLCCITWEDKKAFVAELNEVVAKYSI